MENLTFITKKLSQVNLRDDVDFNAIKNENDHLQKRMAENKVKFQKSMELLKFEGSEMQLLNKDISEKLQELRFAFDNI